MTRKKIPDSKKSSSVRRGQNGRDPIPWRYCLMTLVCGAVLVVGFFLAARQHFSSIDFGIKNSKLRKQIESLEADKRRFILAKEIAMSPSEIKKAAQKLGFQEMSASNIEVYRPVNKEKQKTSLIEKPKQTFLNSVVESKVEPKKEDKKPEKETKKDENKSSETKDQKDKSRTQIAKK